MSTSGQPRLRILGPLRIWRAGAELDAGPRQQAYLLAMLLVRAGRPTSTSELIDLIWDDDVPPSAVNILQKYVGALRRLLEPELPARGTGSYLQRRGGGYLFAAGPDMLDVVAFRELVETARTCLAERRLGEALDSYAEALGLWHGPAGDGLALGPRAMPVFAALNDEFFDACAAAAELAATRSQPERVLAPLRLAAGMAPLHETVQASLVFSLAAAGQQAEALAVFEKVRAQLADELGIDPGPALRAAHLRVLGQPTTSAGPHGADVGGSAGTAGGSLSAQPPTPARPATEPPRPVGRAEEAPAEEAPAERPWTTALGTPHVDGLIGRVEEFGVLRHAVASAFAGGAALVLVEGEPGAGKTRLLEEAGAHADWLGALVVWGRCLEGDGTPAMWPWVQAVGVVLDGLPAAARQGWHAGELGRLVEPRGVVAAPVLPDSGAQFRLFERAVALVGEVSARRPVVLVVDDLQWADVASLQMFSHLAARLPGGTVIVGALRDRVPAPGSELARMLATASRLPRHRRIRLGPLDQAEVAELVHRETGQVPGPAVARSIHARTAGNPFFVRELSRLLADGGELNEDAAARAGVPSTVRDVVRGRMTGLDDDASGLAQIAALIGRDVDLGLLASAADLEVQACIDRLEPLEALGLLEPQPGDPFSFRFAHDLVRESVVSTTPPARAARLHLRVADALERSGADGESIAERLAHHLWAAGPLADPARTAGALERAGRRAAAKSAFDAAARQLVSAAQVARKASLAELELSALSQLTAVIGMRSGYVGSAADLLERAEHLARGLGREREAADFLFSRWAAYSQGIQLDRAGRLARRLLEEGEPSPDQVVRTYGLHAWGIHQWDVGNIGEAFRYLSQSNSIMFDGLAQREDDPLRHDLQLLSPVMLALNTALHGDVDAARALLDTLEAAAGDDSYAVTVWAAFAVTVAALAGDPAWALRAAERGIAVDPEFSFVFLGSYQRLARCWARAVTGEDPAGAAAEAERLIAVALLDPPRSGLATWYGLLAEMWLAAGMLIEAAAALDRAGSFLDTYGQRYPEGHVLLMRARLLQARGEPAAVIRAVAERARALSIKREAHLFARRAEELLTGLA
ncbi:MULTISPECIES: BTAD domain-containing putative transcriptional regulator [unclassified Pseudofrankia]|uniref:ATP-binding protein n=1 Tax=unclassified Pseudofrankia TaxID=2994372 RepID=UPI0008DB1B6F|nr:MULTISPECIES: BTAD domain-containing putative transcriptional regulator [unclassified Pseudofrankia]MDT3439474.1 BTAD domain-containing putative transcriptional regulator [Pseudofrankia sp. BMG5.37]OHV48678.1 transcriptional regulator [Pseudofrankia sp. BMG5.36]